MEARDVRLLTQMLEARQRPDVQMIPGTLLRVFGADGEVQLDGTTTPVGVNMIAPATVGDRVMVLFVPPRAGFVVGTVGGTTAPSANVTWGLQARASATADQTNITTTFIDVTGLSVEFDAQPDRWYRTTVNLPVARQVTNAGEPRAAITDGSGTILQRVIANVGVNGDLPLFVTLMESGLSGRVTRKAQARTTAGGLFLLMGTLGSCVAEITVEDVGPTAD